MLAKITARNRFFPEFWKVSKNNSSNWVHRRPFRQSLAGIFGNFKLLALDCHRSEIEDFVETHLCKLCDTPTARIHTPIARITGCVSLLRI